MTTKRIFAVFIVLVMSSQFAFANYGFYRKVANTCKYYRVTDGKIDSAGFMRLIKNSIQTL